MQTHVKQAALAKWLHKKVSMQTPEHPSWRNKQQAHTPNQEMSKQPSNLAAEHKQLSVNLGETIQKNKQATAGF